MGKVLKMLPRTVPTAWLVLLLGSGISAPAAFAAPAGSPAQFVQHSIQIGTATYKLPDNWVFIKTKCAEGDKACQKKAADFLAKYQDSQGNNYSFLSNQNWLQCLSNCPGGSSSSGIDLDYCMQSPSCLKDVQGTLAAAQTAAAKSADPGQAPDQGIATGDKEAASFLNNPQFMMTSLEQTSRTDSDESGTSGSASKTSTTPSASQVTDAGGQVVSKGGSLTGRGPSYPANPPGGGTGSGATSVGISGAQDNPGLTYARGGFPSNPDSGMSGVTETIVKSSPFLNDHMSFYLASNATPTDLRALQKVGSDVLNPISQQVMGDGTSGRTAFDGQATNLPKDAKRKCGTNFFGVGNCPK